MLPSLLFLFVFFVRNLQQLWLKTLEKSQLSWRMPSEIKLSVDKNARYYVWLALQTRQSCHESPVVQFNIRVTTLAGHEDALRGSQSDHSAECLFWSLQSLDMAIHPSNLWTPFRQTKLGALSVPPLHGSRRGVSTPSTSSEHVFIFSVPAELLLERMMQAAAKQTSLCPRSSVLPCALRCSHHLKMNPAPLSLLTW